MLMAIPYKDKYDMSWVYLYDDSYMTEEQARYNIQTETYSPNGFSISRAQFDMLKKHLKEAD